MEISLLNAVLDSISRFTSLSSCTAVKSEPIRKFYQNIDEALKLLRRVIDAILELEPVSNEQLSKALEEVDAFVNEAIELVESWHQLSSKICVVFQIESLVTKLKGSGLEFCKIVDPNLKLYQQTIELIASEDLSHIIKEAIGNLVENSTPGSDNLEKIVDSLQLTSNQDLLLESVALERVKVKAEHGENNWDPEYVDHMIALVMHMHESLMKAKHSQTVNGVPLPADFCCPLSLELMSDPVIVASGQTYERAFISKWLDQGISVCPKTRQTLSHTNLIPNYTVKALIANWCESNNIKLPDPIKSAALNQPSALLANGNGRPGDSHIFSHTSQAHRSRSPEANRSMSLLPSNGIHSRRRSLSPSHLISSTGAGNGLEADIGRMPFQSSEQESRCDEQSSVRAQPSGSSRMEGSEGSLSNELYINHTRSDSISSAVSSIDANEPSQVSGELTHYISDVSGELVSENSPAPSRGSELPAVIVPEITRPRSHSIWRRPSDRLVPRIVSSTSLEARPDLAGVENEVRKLVEDLQSTSLDVQKDATEKLRLLAKHSMDNRIVIANCGAITYLVNLLHSSDLKTQENAVTALLNLSINDNNKTSIANAGAIEPLIHVLEYGNPEARENSAATLFSLSVLEENKVKIGRSNAIRPLVDLLGNGTPRGKKDAATALFNLSILHENKARIVQAGAVKHLVELMDPAAGMVDKAVAVLANLATIPEGRTAIGQLGGIPVLVEVVELGSSRGKENAASALLHICRHSNRFCTMVLQEGAVPPLVALSQSGTPRAKEKAQALLNYFRSQRHNNAGRG